MVWRLSSLEAMLLALSLLFAAGIWGTYIIAVLCEITGRINKRIFLDKFAMQMARLGLLIHIAFWPALGIGTFLLFQNQPILPGMIRNNLPFLLGTLALGLMGTALLFIYFGTWKTLKKNKKIAHIAIGMTGIICLKPLFWIPAICIRALGMGLNTSLYQAIPGTNSLLWPLGVQWVFQSISLSAVLGLAYLLIRRNSDDFGRDYYKYALPVCAKWALFPMVAVIATCGWIYVLIAPHVPIRNSLPLLSSLGLRATALILAAIIWIIVIRSTRPLRLKGAIISSVILTWLFLIGTLSALWEIIGFYSGLFIPQTFIQDIITSIGWMP